MKTLLFTIAFAFSLLASAQVTQTAPNCADDKEGTKAGKLFDSKGVPWNLSGIKDAPHLAGNIPYTGIVKVCNANTGKVLSKKSYVDGILDGLSYKYHQDGWLKWQKNYASGELDGAAHYYSDGTTKSKEYYVSGKLDGEVIKYFADGTTKSKENYASGKLDGEVIKYFADGTTKSKENYASGQLDGEVIKYFADGAKKSQENYSAGKQDGTQKFFYSNKVLKEVYFCNSDGKKHGLHKYYYKKDSKKFVESYSNGVLDGKQKYYDRNVQLIGEAQWSAGVYQSGNVLKWDEGRLLVGLKDLGEMKWDDAVTECEALGDGWHLPTKDELNLLYQNKEAIGGFAGLIYWSSTELDFDNAWRQSFYNGYQYDGVKGNTCYVRAVRAF